MQLWIVKKSGVLDLVTMKSKIKPPTKNDFLYFKYAFLERLLYNYDNNENSCKPQMKVPVALINKNRSNTYIYIQNSKKILFMIWI